jgi:hypothetical protein
MPRRRIGNAASNWIPKFKSAEHQAMVFGGAFLINEERARQLSSPEEISVQAGVSLQAARIFSSRCKKRWLAQPYRSAFVSLRSSSPPSQRLLPRRRISPNSAPAAVNKSSFPSAINSCVRLATLSTTASRMGIPCSDKNRATV